MILNNFKTNNKKWWLQQAIAVAKTITIHSSIKVAPRLAFTIISHKSAIITKLEEANSLSNNHISNKELILLSWKRLLVIRFCQLGQLNNKCTKEPHSQQPRTKGYSRQLKSSAYNWISHLWLTVISIRIARLSIIAKAQVSNSSRWRQIIKYRIRT